MLVRPVLTIAMFVYAKTERERWI